MSPSDGGPGRVYLVGAGPGDPGLLTARALELIAVADVILYDRLIPAAALDVARPEAELVFVGKEGTGESVPQEQTEQLMLARARSGRTVVRLKGGDPFVFGRGGEEALALRAASIPYEIVPGVSAGVAAPAYAGIPVTHRGSASAVALVTGHEDPAKDASAIDWPALAAFPGTIVFYMAGRRLPELAQALLAAGRDPAQPAAVIEAGTLPEQRTITATLQTIAQRAGEEGVGAPAITVIGPVAALAGELSWLPERPLHGVSVAVTRARAQGSALAARLAQLGARTVQAPVIETVPLPGEIPDLRGYDLICMTSPVGVAQLVQRLLADGRDARALAGARVAAIGAGTAEALRERGVLADVIPRRAVAEGLVEELAASELPVRRALIARAREGRELLAQALRERGAEVDVLALYETVARPLSERVLAAVRAADYVTFTSSSTVRFFLRAAGGEAGLSPSTRVVSIGPVTSETLREHGLEPHVEAETHDVQGVIDAVVEDAAAPS